MRKSNTQLRFWLLTILTMLLLFSLTGCAACGQRNTETNNTETTETNDTETTDMETTETITEPETSIETNTTDEGLSSSDTNTSDEPETTEPELTVEGNGTGVDGVSDEEVQAEIDEAPVSDTSEGRGLEDLDEETLEMTNNLTFNGVQYDTIEEWQKAVNEWSIANDPEMYTREEADETFNW